MWVFGGLGWVFFVIVISGNLFYKVMFVIEITIFFHKINTTVPKRITDKEEAVFMLEFKPAD